LKKGYRGSVSSAKWQNIWKQEIKNHPHLFRTYIIPGTSRNSKEEITKLEGQWQKLFDVLNDINFINLSICRGEILFNTGGC
jgi:hypothetical protein